MLIADRLHVARDGGVVLRDLAIRIAPGCVTALLGRNGAGKSTLLKVLAGDLRIGGAARGATVRGDVTLNGEPLHRIDAPRLARLRAVLPQASQPAFPFGALEIVLLGRYPHTRRTGALAREDREIASQALALAGASALDTRDVTTLSGGELARVQFARVLAQLWPSDESDESASAPRYLLLDEPTAALDLAHQHQLLDTVRRLSRDWGIGVLTIVHDPNLAARHADRIAMLADGAIVADGAPADVLRPDLIERCYGFRVRLVDAGDGAAPVIVPA
ncbi:heme ABC transporter ATP-binding protein [Burkholderia oklahomensis]|uniref:Hemin import ATP-binding protein HmuV n=1 Tax=Burkholderia oklahomensis TaxID=342113 RepID=A0AAI8FPF3_9BURK|nr:heme ABC transporter ATP-binding protein [Burkholderia oklahomensis]AIO68566.1 hemin import ATP-binding protein HmuV [Burkholderia oklahomensis]AJX34959.1 hemin import ATP-binding protein HmuV [Burkholderia oklahomensis C6786]AOI40206.1 hemin importer ATP-binding subunit [Burkholderia oklahomensis EO147]AOI49826.1 hemin importer ATP-binding subunit [Burkholderia oklahomensis C6786]KUY47300.1 hemin importer ATP-binding subunit [Burkholderia oklahomensis C6786]